MPDRARPGVGHAPHSRSGPRGAGVGRTPHAGRRTRRRGWCHGRCPPDGANRTIEPHSENGSEPETRRPPCARQRTRWRPSSRSATSTRRARTGASQCVRHIDLPAGADFRPLLGACPATTAAARTGATSSRARSHIQYADGTDGREPGRRPLLLARRPHRLDRRGRRLRRVQPRRRDPARCSSTSAPSWPRRDRRSGRAGSVGSP